MSGKIDEIDRDLLSRQSQILYPEVETWILNMALEAYINSLDESEVTEEETQDTVIINKQCDDDVCLSCGSKKTKNLIFYIC